ALAIDSSLKDQKLLDAIAFINFLTSDSLYYDALTTRTSHTPRYLLPAYRHLYDDKTILSSAPYYKSLLPLATKIKSFTGDNFCPILRQIGKKLNTKILKD